MFRVRINDTESACTRTEKRSGCTYYDTYTLTDGRTFSRYRDHAQRAAAKGEPVGMIDGSEVFAVAGFTPDDPMETLLMKRKLKEDGVPVEEPTVDDVRQALAATGLILFF